MNEQRTNKGKIQKTKKMLRGNGSQAKLKLAESEQRKSEQIKIKNGNGKLGIVGDKEKFKLKTGEEVEGILQNDGLFHMSMTNKEKIVILLDGEKEDELIIQTIKFYKDKTVKVINESGKAGKILKKVEELKKEKGVFIFTHRENTIPKDSYQVLEASHLINATDIKNAEYKAGQKVIFSNTKGGCEISIMFSVDFNEKKIDFSFYETLRDLCLQNENKSYFTLNEFIRAHTGKEKNEDIKHLKKSDFYNRLKKLSMTKGALNVGSGYLEKWQCRERDALDEESINILLGRERLFDVFPCDTIDYIKHPNANEAEAVFYFDKDAFFHSPLFLLFKGKQQFVTIPQKQKLIGGGIKYSDENQVIHNDIIRIIKSYDVTRNVKLEKKDFAKNREFKSRTEKARFIDKLKIMLKSIQAESELETAPYFYFENSILRFDKARFSQAQESKIMKK